MRTSLLASLLPSLVLVAYGGKPPGERQLSALRKQVAVSATGEQSAALAAELVVAAGCFWGVELAFSRLPGVLSTEVGYVGGHTEAPTYRTVSRGDTMHAEAVRLTYDPSILSIDELLGVFFDVHDPTSLNRQGGDVGTQYRSAIFYADAEMEAAARRARDAEAHRRGRTLATTIEPLGPFTRAENYHQAYLQKGGQSALKGEEAPIRCYG